MMAMAAAANTHATVLMIASSVGPEGGR